MSPPTVSMADVFALLNTRAGSLRRLREATGASAEEIQRALGELEDLLADGKLGVALERDGAQYRIVVKSEKNDLVREYLGVRRRTRLGLAASETLFFIMKHPGMSTSELGEARDIARPESTLRLLRRKGLIASTPRGEESRGRGRGSPLGHHATKKAWAMFPELEATLRGGREHDKGGGMPAETVAAREGEVGGETTEQDETRHEAVAEMDTEPEDSTSVPGAVALDGTADQDEAASRPRGANHEYLEIEVAVAGIRQRIWRRFLLKADATFYDLHDAIHDASGSWEEGFHLWEFHAGGETIGPSEHGNVDRYASEVQVRDVLEKRGSCIYHYDFGDDWIVDVDLRGVVEKKGVFERKLLGGRGAWPPEDCGGPMMWRSRGGKMRENEIREEFDK